MRVVPGCLGSSFPTNIKLDLKRLAPFRSKSYQFYPLDSIGYQNYVFGQSQVLGVTFHWWKVFAGFRNKWGFDALKNY